MAVDYTLAELRQNVSLNLGDGRVDVELNNHHFQRGLDAALKALARHYPQHGYQVISVSFGSLKYKLTARNILGVLDCTPFNSGPRFEEAPYYTRWVDRMMELGDMQDTQRVFGDKPDWHAQWETDTQTNERAMWVYVHFTRSSFVDTFARTPTAACVQFAWYIEASDDLQVGVRQIPYDFRQWVEDFATAKCRTILGDIRGKFAGIPGAADGSMLPNDANGQIQRGERDMGRLMSDLEERRRQLPIMID
jgi:hypothetical protein